MSVGPRATVSKLSPGPGDVILKVDSEVSITIAGPKLSLLIQVMLGSGGPLALQRMVTLLVRRDWSSMTVLESGSSVGMISFGSTLRAVTAISPGDVLPEKKLLSIVGASVRVGRKRI